jgi:YHS domain-containing protein
MNRIACFYLIGALVCSAAVAPALADRNNHATEQVSCPVMEENPIKKSIYVDHQGKRVYFCCDFCKGEFLNAPGKYLDKLPQFRSAEDATAAHAHGHELEESPTGWRLYRLTAPLGIATVSLLALTLCTGLLRRKLKRRFLRVHRTLAVATGIVATLHALTVLLGH